MERILGQSPAIETLQQVVRGGRIHHAWIFAGPLGVGKFTTAIELAKILLDPKGVNPSGEISRLIDQDFHPDLHIIRKELASSSIDPEIRNKKQTNIPVGVLREHMVGGESGGRFFDPKVYLSPRMGHGKVFIIDEAELIDATGQNVLLKTLEETPPRTYIILVTTQPDRLLPTIRSRCQRVTFLPLDEAAMKEWWSQSGASANLHADERAWIDEFAEGSPGLATLAITDRLIEWRAVVEPVIREAERGRFVAGGGEAIAGLIDAWAKARTNEDETISKEILNREGARRVFLMLAGHARKGLRAAVSHGEESEPALRTIDLVREAERHMSSNVNLKFIFENLVAQWVDAHAPVGAR